MGQEVLFYVRKTSEDIQENFKLKQFKIHYIIDIYLFCIEPSQSKTGIGMTSNAIAAPNRHPKALVSP